MGNWFKHRTAVQFKQKIAVGKRLVKGENIRIAKRLRAWQGEELKEMRGVKVRREILLLLTFLSIDNLFL